MATSDAGQIPSAEDLKLYTLQQKYAEEAAKRFRPEFTAQFVSLADADDKRIHALGDDPWVDHTALNAKPPVADGARYKFVVLGTGFGGIIFAVRLIEAGLVKGPQDLLLIDTAGGFGGTWYWNRYPGLHCDIESYTYLPLLEETGFVPKFRYSPGYEIREHAERIATKWNLNDKVLFRTKTNSARWDDAGKVWNIAVTENRGPAEPSRDLTIKAEYFMSCVGVFPKPHAPKIPGLNSFAGPLFHTSRWDYSVTGGSQDSPELTKLEGKRVGIIGTGATAVQAVPALAKYAKELYVFQRTPSSVWPRDQRPTDPEEWKTKIATHPGWQLERMANLNAFLTNAATEDLPNLVDDAWSRMPAYCANVGCPKWGYIEPTPEKIGEHIGRLMRLDLANAEAARARVDATIKDPTTAAKLKAWYPVWCKRPTFSDDYLETFNLPHVHLVDTDGKGVESSTSKGLVAGGSEYDLDILILGTGYEGPVTHDGDPTARADFSVTGREGRTLSQKWAEQGVTTLHGFSSHGFPNFFFQNAVQGASGANYAYSLETWSRHLADVIRQAEERAPAPGKRVVVENTVEAEEAWAGELMRHGPYYASMMGCTPSYNNAEGAMAQMPSDPAEMMKKARLAAWSFGLESFAKVLEDFRKGGVKGFEVTGADV
ncbi:Pentalenolactone D synthase [Echria macrotheca]|uniref:Pentalenolactone D synthase n=1 Tax=Echria macrotheca TaxID=438768 RepID=A0AAJ0F9N8_9PEZI|nr:Pentalenolactone D synthase [Echria macrotheca]